MVIYTFFIIGTRGLWEEDLMIWMKKSVHPWVDAFFCLDGDQRWMPRF